MVVIVAVLTLVLIVAVVVAAVIAAVMEVVCHVCLMKKKKKGCKQACKAVWKLGCYRASVAKKSEVYCIFIVNTQIINHNFVLRLLKIMAQKMSELHVFEDCQTLMPFSDFFCCCCRGVWLLFYEQHLICYKRTVIHDTEIMMHIRFTLKF